MKDDSSRMPRINSNSRHAKILNNLSKVAVAVDPVAAARIAAAVVVRGDIISIGFNRLKSHTFQSYFSRNEKSIYLHAENDAIYRATKSIPYSLLKKATLYVCRVKHLHANENIMIFGQSKPCEGCMKAIKMHGIKTVIHTCDSDAFGDQYMVMNAA